MIFLAFVVAAVARKLSEDVSGIRSTGAKDGDLR